MSYLTTTVNVTYNIDLGECGEREIEFDYEVEVDVDDFIEFVANDCCSEIEEEVLIETLLRVCPDTVCKKVAEHLGINLE